MILFNFKAYTESTGARSLTLSRLAKRWSSRMRVETAVAPAQQDLRFVTHSVKQERFFRVFAQHADVVSSGAFTGSVSLEAVRDNGCFGVLLNHYEKRLAKPKLRQLVEGARLFGLHAVVCAKSVDESVKLAAFNPWAVAVEPPELIGSGISVSTARPGVVSDAVEKIHAKNPFCKVIVGAGVSTGKDVAQAKKLGAYGVIISSQFVKAENHAEKLNELLQGWTR